MVAATISMIENLVMRGIPVVTTRERPLLAFRRSNTVAQGPIDQHRACVDALMPSDVSQTLSLQSDHDTLS